MKQRWQPRLENFVLKIHGRINRIINRRIRRRYQDWE